MLFVYKKYVDTLYEKNIDEYRDALNRDNFHVAHLIVE
jgi:hypothetical protein